MTKINHEEYEILKGLEDIWKWIARDNKGYGTKLKAHTSRPGKMIDSRWSSGDIMLQLSEREGLFQFVQWEDSEPYNIQELIEEYEEEREETEVKRDIEWAKNKIDLEVIRRIGREDPHFYVSVGLKRALDFLNQIDEPETLSSDWISDNVEYAYYMTPKGTYSSAKAVIDPNKLKNTLVPKQEKVKIESVWAEDIEDAKASGMTLFKTMDWMAIDSDEKEKQDLFARAWLDGFTVEGEQKYYVDLNTAAYVAKWDGNDQVDIYTDGISGSDEYELHLTEQEIKDFDERFWPFRKPVEEVE